MSNARKIFDQKTIALQKKFVTLLSKSITDFRSSFIQLYQSDSHSAVSTLSLTPFNTDILSILQQIYRYAGDFGARLADKELKAKLTPKDRQQIREYLQGQKQLKAASFGKNEEWIKAVLDYLNRFNLELVSSITNTMREDILKVISEGIENGWSIDEVVARLKETGLIEARARVIARTEIIRAANVGHSVAASDTPYEVEKKWSAARDHRTRHSHVFINGTTIEENGLFIVPIYKGKTKIGEDKMLYPGDATAHPSNTINCRCRAVYIPKRDANGRLIMRSQQQSAIVIPMRTINTFPAHQIAAALKANATIKVEI